MRSAAVGGRAAGAAVECARTLGSAEELTGKLKCAIVAAKGRAERAVRWRSMRGARADRAESGGVHLALHHGDQASPACDYMRETGDSAPRTKRQSPTCCLCPAGGSESQPAPATDSLTSLSARAWVACRPGYLLSCSIQLEARELNIARVRRALSPSIRCADLAESLRCALATVMPRAANGSEYKDHSDFYSPRRRFREADGRFWLLRLARPGEAGTGDDCSTHAGGCRYAPVWSSESLIRIPRTVSERSLAAALASPAESLTDSSFSPLAGAIEPVRTARSALLERA